MNKLEVAIRLLQLLNERKTVTSKVIADEFQVSLRTAQRYIRELSSLPCFVSTGNTNGYELYPNYKLKDALLNTSACDILVKNLRNRHGASGAGEVICLFCGLAREKVSQSLFVIDAGDINDEHRFELLMARIRRELESKRCSFPE